MDVSTPKHDIDAVQNLLDQIWRESPGSLTEQTPINGDDLRSIRY